MSELRKIIIMVHFPISGDIEVIKRFSSHKTNQELEQSCDLRAENTGFKYSWAILPKKFS